MFHIMEYKCTNSANDIILFKFIIRNRVSTNRKSLSKNDKIIENYQKIIVFPYYTELDCTEWVGRRTSSFRVILFARCIVAIVDNRMENAIR